MDSLIREHRAHLEVFETADANALFVGESEENLRESFRRAQIPLTDHSLSVLFIDGLVSCLIQFVFSSNLDLKERICGKRGELAETHSNRLVGQLLTLMDGINTSKGTGQEQRMAPILVVASTEDPNRLDEALRRSGRFDYEIWVGTDLQGPQAIQQRENILSQLLSQVPLHSSLQDTLPIAVRRLPLVADI